MKIHAIITGFLLFFLFLFIDKAQSKSPQRTCLPQLIIKDDIQYTHRRAFKWDRVSPLNPYALALYEGAFSAVGYQEGSLHARYPGLAKYFSVLASDLPDLPQLAKKHLQTHGSEILVTQLILKIVEARNRQARFMRELAKNFSHEENFQALLLKSAREVEVKTPERNLSLKAVLKRYQGVKLNHLTPKFEHIELFRNWLSPAKGVQGEVIFYILSHSVQEVNWRVSNDEYFTRLYQERIIPKGLYSREIDLILKPKPGEDLSPVYLPRRYKQKRFARHSYQGVIWVEVKNFWKVLTHERQSFVSLLKQIDAYKELIRHLEYPVELRLYIVRGITQTAKELLEEKGVKVFSQVVEE